MLEKTLIGLVKACRVPSGLDKEWEVGSTGEEPENKMIPSRAVAPGKSAEHSE